MVRDTMTKKEFNWVLVYSFRGLVQYHSGGKHRGTAEYIGNTEYTIALDTRAGLEFVIFLPQLPV